MSKTDIKTYTAMIGLGLALVASLSSFGKVYFIVPAEVARLKEEIKDIKQDMKEYSNKELTDREDIIQLKTQVEYIREDTGEILQYIKTLK